MLQELDAPEPWRIVVYAQAERAFAATLDSVQLLLLDEGVVGSDYISLVRKAQRRYPGVSILVVGGPKSDDVRAAELRQGVDHYYERPLEAEPVAAAIQHQLAVAQLKAEVGLVGRSIQIEEILEAILQVGPTEVPILVEGESGTGKDVIARAVHAASRRRTGPYVALNVASLAEGVLESELFGHEKGAFTGAVSQRAGVFERADKGTLFLDEVGEMDHGMQVRLLRALESGEVMRVGGVKSVPVDVRIISATNRNLLEAVESGRFRQDLYYRLKGVSFFLPPLRERKEDIPTLVDYFIKAANARHNKRVKGVDAGALRLLMDNPWAGNVRELRNVIDTTVVLSPQGRISADLVRSQLGGPAHPPESPMLPVPLHRAKDEAEREMIYASILALHRDVREILTLLRDGDAAGPMSGLREVRSDFDDTAAEVPSLTALERQAIMEALRATSGNRRKAAEKLGISERTLYRKIKEYGLV